MLYPILFQPIFKERIWGGRQLETLYQKQLPAGVPIGESWEISDRPGAASVIADAAGWKSLDAELEKSHGRRAA